MYNEEPEGFEEAESTPPAYVTKVSQQDAEKLARENERLKKSLEKEKFFNKLLDQELKETKAEASTRIPVDYAPADRGISKGAFYTVLILALALAGFLLYNFYNKGESPVNTTTTAPANTDETAPAQENVVKENPVAPIAKDTVPEIIATAPVTKPAEEIKKTVASPQVVIKNNNNTVKEEVTEKVLIKEKPASTAGASAKVVQRDIPSNTKPAPVVEQPKPATPAPVSRPVIATYKVPSKANFYNSADENTLRSAFINGGNKTVNALEDKNGFIYVEYTNENGMVNRGWLSKKDLTQE